MTLGRSYRRATLNDSFRSPLNECRTFFSNDEKRYDEDGYLSPLEIKVQVNHLHVTFLFIQSRSYFSPIKINHHKNVLIIDKHL